jgi:phosphomannomutase
LSSESLTFTFNCWSEDDLQRQIKVRKERKNKKENKETDEEVKEKEIKITFRTSGTEPKIKFYSEILGMCI